MRGFRLGRLVLVSLGLVLAVTLAPRAYASPQGAGVPGDNSGPSGHTSSGAASPVAQDPAWLAAKNAHRVRSGVIRGQGKGAKTHPYVQYPAQSSLAPLTVFPSDQLPQYNTVLGTWEPSDGSYSNTGAGTAHTDYASSPYGDEDFFGMCGPGAADIALYYWPAPPNSLGPITVTDYGPTHAGLSAVSTTWSSPQLRGYMTHLAWEIQWPNWPNNGMLDQTHYDPAHGSYTYGTTLYGMQDALNWEASGESPSTWLNYFYVIVWGSNANQSVFHGDVVSDIFYDSVPVVAEVNAAMLPNWNRPGQMIRHFVTIIGYDDTNGTYTYTDTCGKTTHCGDQTFGQDGQTNTVSQAVMWNAIAAIPSTPVPGDPTQGDGGYVW